jgi:hypothetical protein
MSTNVYPGLTHSFRPALHHSTLVAYNREFADAIRSMLGLLAMDVPTYARLEARIHTVNSWNGPMVRYQASDDIEQRGYFPYYTHMRLTDSDMEDHADIFVCTQAPLGSKQWRIRYGHTVVCPDRVTFFDPDNADALPVFSYDLFLPRQRKALDTLRHYCLSKA